MIRHKVIIELAAAQDIDRAYLWLADRAPEAAIDWFNGIYDAINSLEYFPERCPLAPEGTWFDWEIREIFHGRRQHKYRILFTLNQGEVSVLHVRHGARLAWGELDFTAE